MATISEFISNLDRHNGLSKSERFEVRIYPPVGLLSIINYTRDLTLQCDMAELPGSGFRTYDFRTYGPERKFPIIRGYQDISLSFICTGDFYEKPLFEKWIEYINPRSSGWNFRYKDEFASTIEISQLYMSNRIVYKTKLLKAFPLAMEPMKLNWLSNDSSNHKLNVTFAYDKYLPDITYNNMFAETLRTTEIKIPSDPFAFQG